MNAVDHWATLESRLQTAFERQAWAEVLAAAGEAIVQKPEMQFPFVQVARLCYLLGDDTVGKAYLQQAKKSQQTAHSPSGSILDAEELDLQAAQWVEQAKLIPFSLSPSSDQTGNESFRLIAGGDVMLGRQMPGWVGLRGPELPFAKIASVLRTADMSMVNLEVCVSTEGDFLDKGGRQPYYYHCLPEMLDVLASAGIACVATGNNHAMDFGAQALIQQTDTLEASGFLHFGAGINATEAAKPRYAKVNGIVVAFIGVETETPSMAAGTQSAGINYLNLSDLVRKVSGSIAVARAHADCVVVSPHWGVNWESAPSDAARLCARKLIDLGADAILGHSAHILQGVEVYAGRPIVYDMGTLLFDRVAQNTMKDSALFDLDWRARGTCELTVRPVRLRTARAELAEGDDFERIRSLMNRLSRDLNPSAAIELCGEGLKFRAQTEHSAVRKIVKLQPDKVYEPARTSPRVTSASRALRSNLVYERVPKIDGIWPEPLKVNPDLIILGARYATPVRPGRGFVCEVYFRANAPANGTRVEARLVGFDAQGKEAFRYIHPVAEGIHPPARWSMASIVCDRICVRPVTVVPDGVYTLCWSLIDLESGDFMPAVSEDARIVQGQVRIGELVVSAEAPSGVVGIAAPPKLLRHEPHTRPTYGGWQGQVKKFWMEEAQGWVRDSLKKVDLSLLSVEPVIVRDSPSVLVIRVETSAGAYFFKAVEAINHFEPALVTLLAQRWSDRIASPTAVLLERGWMLTKNFGVELRSLGDKSSRNQTLQKAASQLAEIQIASCQQVQQLLDIGVADRRLHLLPELFEQLLNNPEAIHLDQADGLKKDELDLALSMLPTLRMVCQQLGHSDFSAGLDHGDLHLGNLLVKDDKVVLFDWDTAWVTHPFCSLLLAYHATGLKNESDLRSLDALGQAYLKPWSKHTGQAVDQLVPILNLAIWIAHAKRAIFWSHAPDKLGMTKEGPQTVTSRWVRWWLQRAELLGIGLAPQLAVPLTQQTRALSPAKLATPDNPLLLDKKTIADLTGGTWTGLPEDVFLTGMSFIRNYLAEGSSGNLYFAAQLDSTHSYTDAEIRSMALKGLEHGAAAAVVPNNISDLPANLPLLKIPADIYSLDALGFHVRDKLFTGKRVLVSGTEGKTGFKNMLHHVLSPQISTHAVTNSSNLGFSIMASLASIRQKDRIAIFEAAGTHPGRLAKRSGYVKPHLFVLTEVGNEHINYHGSQQAVIESKADIVTGLVDGGFGLINADSRNYMATRQAVLARKRVPLCLFGSHAHCNGRLLAREFKNNAWQVTADIEGNVVQYRLPLLGDHAPLASVSVLLAAYYLGADVALAATEFDTFRPYESQGALRRLSHRGGEISCYDNASRASVLSYQSTLGMAAKLSPPSPNGKKVAVIGQMIFLGNESESGHIQIAPWIDEAKFDRIILVGKFTEVTFAHLKNQSAVIHRFPTYDRRTSSKKELQALIDATEAACEPGDLLFIKGEVDELGEHLRSKELPSGVPLPTYAVVKPTAPKPATSVDSSVLTGLRQLQLSDLALYRAAIDQTQRTTWQHYFPFIYLLGQSGGHRFLVEEDSGSFCIYLLREKKHEKSLSVFLLPMPAQPAVIERCIQRVKAFNKADRASLFRVDPDDTALFKGRPNTRIVTCLQEYIYAPANYLDLSGNKKRNLRRAIQSVEKMDGLEVLDYDVSFAAECRQVLEQWAQLQREKYGGVQYGGFTHNCLDVYDQFPRRDLFGKVIRLDGKVCSFGFAGEMRKGMGNLFITYSDHRIEGLNKFLYQQLLLNMQHLEFANSSHAGDTPGLAFAKQALGPAYMFQPHQVYAG